MTRSACAFFFGMSVTLAVAPLILGLALVQVAIADPSTHP